MRAVIVISLAVVAYALVSRRVSTTPVTGAMLFMVLGLVIGPEALGAVEGVGDRLVFETLLEVALALVLFSDALEISAGDLREKSRLPARLLLIGMPLTMAFGWVAGVALFGRIDVWEAALIGICLAPTDAALGQAVVTDPKVPGTIRQALNIESGLNDGLALPFFVIALGAAVETETTGGVGVAEVLFRSVVYAVAVGLVVGWAGARLLSASRRRGWVDRGWSQIATLGLVIVAYAVADVGEGSGFIATWVAGVTFGRTMGSEVGETPVLSQDLGGLFATVSFVGFGAIILGPTLEHLDTTVVVYALLSLTVIRMLPVAASLIGMRLRAPTLVFMGWFGPRGLASIVFGLLLAEEALPGGSRVLEAVNVTVALSVVLHGATAVWGADRYGRWFERSRVTRPLDGEVEDVGEPQVRRRLRVRSAAADGS